MKKYLIFLAVAVSAIVSAQTNPTPIYSDLEVYGDIYGKKHLQTDSGIVAPYGTELIWKGLGNSELLVDSNDIVMTADTNCVATKLYNGSSYQDIIASCFSITTSGFENLYWTNFDGNNDYATAGAQPSLEFQPNERFTLVSRLANTRTLSIGNQAIFGNWSGGDGYIFTFTNDNDIPVLKFTFASSNSRRIIVQSDEITRYTIKQVAVTYDGSGDASGVTIYVDGEEINSTIQDNDLLTPIYVSDFNVGGETAGFYYEGYLDEMVVFDDTLSASEINTIYNDGEAYDYTGFDHIQNWWRMGDNDSFPTLFDNVGSVDLTMTNMDSTDIELIGDRSDIQLTCIFGQSNARGLAATASLPAAISNFEDAYIYIESTDQFDPIEVGVNLQANNSNSHGSEITFAYEYNQTFEDGKDTSFIVKSTQNSTSLAVDWLPPLGTQYLNAVSKLEDAITDLSKNRIRNVSDTITVFWFQGETDGTDSTWASNYAANMNLFVDSFRAQFTDKVIVFVDMSLPTGLENVSSFEWADTVVAKKEEVAAIKDNYFLISSTAAFDLKADSIHYSSAGYQTIADTMVTYVTKQPTSNSSSQLTATFFPEIQVSGDIIPTDTNINIGSLSSPFDTVVAQKLIVDSNSIVFRGTGQSISATSEGISMANCNTGWASYSDGQFVTDTPFVLSTTDTWVTLPNDAETVINSQLPCGIDSFYNATDSTIVSNGSGDDIIITILFKVRPNTNNEVEFDFALDVGGAIGQTFEDTRTYHKGQDVEHFFNATYSGYTLDTWASNGAKIKVRTDESVDIYDIQYVIKRTHKAR